MGEVKYWDGEDFTVLDSKDAQSVNGIKFRINVDILEYSNDGLTWSSAGQGDMIKAVYDINDNGIVDNAEKVSGFTVGVNVPANAKFTDTTYGVATTSANGLMSSTDKQNLDISTTSRHTHTNKSVIDKFSEAGGEVLYNNQPISGGVSSWDDLEDKPISLVEDIDSAVELKHPHNNKSIIDNFGCLNGELYYGETPLTFLPSEGGGDALVHRYVHTSNKVIQPTGLDKSTGLFTTIEPINLPAGTKRQVITAFNYQSDGIMPREWNPVDAHFIEVVDSYSFYILQGSASGARITYTNASNTGIDVNAFRFEYDYSNSPIIDLSALNIKNGRFRFKGTRHRPGWSYVYLDMTHDGGSYQHSYGTFVDGRDYLSLDISGLFSIEDNFVSARIDNYIKSEWDNGKGTWAFYQGNNGSVLASHFKNPTFNSLNISFAMSNGSVIEIYDITDSLNSGSGSVDIVDNLTTNDGSKALSAKQGKILNDGKVDNSRVLTNVPVGAKFTDTNTTYSEISEVEINTGTASTLRTMTARRITFIINKIMGVVSGELNNKVDKGQPFTWGNLKNGL